jgi:hypothetical protein
MEDHVNTEPFRQIESVSKQNERFQWVMPGYGDSSMIFRARP